MKLLKFKSAVMAVIIASGISATSCKSKPKEETNTSTTTAPAETTTPAPAPVEISVDTTLQKGVADATKDYPGVKAQVNNGEITLTGEIQRSKLPDLMKTLNSLRPKKINNNLTIK
jgi:hypothetical protein